MAKPFIINPDVQPDPANPHSWFPLIGHPKGETGSGEYRVMAGVMRPEYRQFRPSLAAFVQAKLAPAAPSDAAPWAISTYRHEVLLPPQAGDHLRDPRTLIETAEREQAPSAKALASYITLTSTTNALHTQYEVAREVGRWLVAEFQVAVLLVQHVPSLNLGSAEPHVHIIVPGPRAITPYSTFGQPVAALSGDKGRDFVLARLATLVADEDQ